MNKLKLITVSFTLLLLYSCGSDKPAEQIIGIWNVSTVEYSDCENPSNNEIEFYGEASCEDFSGEIECEEVTINFGAGESLITTVSETINGVVEDSEAIQGTYSFSEMNEDEVTICPNGNCITGTISFSGSNMTFIGTDSDCTFTLKASK